MRNLQLSPSGDRVTFIQGKAGDQNQLDLWEFNLAENKTQLLVDSTALLANETLSQAEKARRERMRQAGLRGIIDYQWTKAGNALLFPLGGDLYYYQLADQSVVQLTHGEGFVIDPKLSPDEKKSGLCSRSKRHGYRYRQPKADGIDH